jgi:predicted O-methyltransferase YrrM
MTADRVRAVRERLLAAGSVVDRAGRSHDLFPVAIGPAEGVALRDAVRREGARATLEVGLGYGIAALAICEALVANGPGARHVAIDPYQSVARAGSGVVFAGTGLDVLEEAGVRDIVELHEVPSQIVLPQLLAEGRRFDFAFIDGSHRFDAVFLDLVHCIRLVHPGSAVFVDDAQIPPVGKAIAYCERNLGCAVEDDGAEGPDHSWRVLRTPARDPFHGSYAEFADF